MGKVCRRGNGFTLEDWGEQRTKATPVTPHLHLPTPPALQEKVAEVETRLREQLLETERRLNEARREHGKAGEICWDAHGLLGRFRKCWT